MNTAALCLLRVGLTQSSQFFTFTYIYSVPTVCDSYCRQTRCNNGK
jgi:hypothetical protein